MSEIAGRKYIAAKALERAMLAEAAADKDKNRRTWVRALGLLHDAPAADVAPVVHGLWDDSGRYTFSDGSVAVRCSECGCALTESEYALNNWNFCPVCGARMDGGAENG